MIGVLCVALALAAQSPAPAGARYAVMKTEVGGGLDPAVGPQVAAKLAEALRQRTGAEVISSDEMVAMLQHEKERTILGNCKEKNSCLAELASALGADAIVAPRLSRVDGALLLSVSVVDAHTASVRSRVTETWGGESLLLLALARRSGLLAGARRQMADDQGHRQQPYEGHHILLIADHEGVVRRHKTEVEKSHRQSTCHSRGPATQPVGHQTDYQKVKHHQIGRGQDAADGKTQRCDQNHRQQRLQVSEPGPGGAPDRRD